MRAWISLGLAVSVAAVVVLAVPPPAPAASAPVRLMCAGWNDDGEFLSVPKHAPARCVISRENWAHYQQLSFIRGRWTGWERPYARATATMTYNMGFRARVRITAYRRRPDCTGTFMAYTRVRLDYRGRSHTFRPDTCPNVGVPTCSDDPEVTSLPYCNEPDPDAPPCSDDPEVTSLPYCNEPDPDGPACSDDPEVTWLPYCSEP